MKDLLRCAPLLAILPIMSFTLGRFALPTDPSLSLSADPARSPLTAFDHLLSTNPACPFVSGPLHSLFSVSVNALTGNGPDNSPDNGSDSSLGNGPDNTPDNFYNNLYQLLNLDSLELSSEAYQAALAGFLALKATGALHNDGILSIVDFTLPSNKKRLFILDLINGRLLFNTFVAHGKNSGQLLATRFSNRRNSYKSSLGAYLTGEPFIGRHGYSLRLMGQNPGWNDNAFSRNIIMHPAGYVSEDHIRQWGYLGRSEGCPAIPEELGRPIIETIQGGSCLFLYGPGKQGSAHFSARLNKTPRSRGIPHGRRGSGDHTA